jgi:hypothetical protein
MPGPTPGGVVLISLAMRGCALREKSDIADDFLRAKDARLWDEFRGWDETRNGNRQKI